MHCEYVCAKPINKCSKISDLAMDQASYLSQRLWEYQGSCQYTDLTLVCEDGILTAHAAMLSGLFTRLNINCPSREEVPECVFLPDLITVEVQSALKALYLQNNVDSFLCLMKDTLPIVKQEQDNNIENSEHIAVNDEDEEVKDDIIKTNSIEYSNDDNKEWSLDIPESMVKVGKMAQIPKTKKIKYCLMPTVVSFNSVKYEHEDLNEDVNMNHDNNKKLCPSNDLNNPINTTQDIKIKIMKYIEKQDNLFVCTVCQKGFHKLRDTKCHLKCVHSVGATLECDECSKLFYYQHKLDLHKLSHVAERKFVCEQCGNDFTTNTGLINHVSKQHNPPQYGCSICAKCFRTPEVLSDHEKTHSSEKPELCSKCDKTFKTKSSLRTHTKRKHLGYKEPEKTKEEKEKMKAYLRAYALKRRAEKKAKNNGVLRTGEERTQFNNYMREWNAKKRKDKVK